MELPTPFRMSRDGQLTQFDFTPVRHLVHSGLIGSGSGQQPEAALEDVISRFPGLLGLEGRWKAFRQCQLPRASQSAIRPDIILLSDQGNLVVVEVKVQGNDELRNRSIISQAIEYVACLRRMSPEALAKCLAGSPQDHTGERTDELLTLPGFVRMLFSDRDGDAVAGAMMDNLKRGRVDVILACDKAPAGLREVVRSAFEDEIGDFQLQVVEIAPYKCGDDVLLLPITRLETETIRRFVIAGLFEDKPITAYPQAAEQPGERALGRTREAAWTAEEFVERINTGPLSRTREGRFLQTLLGRLLKLQDEGVLDIEGTRSSAIARLRVLIGGYPVLRLSTSPSIRLFFDPLETTSRSGVELLEELSKILDDSPKDQANIMPELMQRDPEGVALEEWLRHVKQSVK